MKIEEIKIKTVDNFELAATLFTPQNANGKAVLINSATGVKRNFYKRFASYLAEQGFVTLTYDYRGVGDSRPVTLNKFKAFMHEWGEKDMAGAIAWLAANYPSCTIFAVGHSVAGQVMGLAANNDRIAAMILVASQSGYWKLWPWQQKYLVFIFWHAVIPIFSILCSYFPAKIFGMGEDLPAGVALEWASWGRDPKYILGKNRLTTKGNFTRFRAPILFFSVENDFYAPERSVDELMTFYPNAQTSKKVLSAKTLKVGRFGHFDFYKEKFRDSLWAESVVWLETNHS